MRRPNWRAIARGALALLFMPALMASYCYWHAILGPNGLCAAFVTTNSPVTLSVGQSVAVQTANCSHAMVIVWTSTDPSVATVDGAGTVYAVSSGVTSIVATRSDSEQAEVRVTVVNQGS
jgi:hypothetical protein